MLWSAPRVLGFKAPELAVQVVLGLEDAVRQALDLVGLQAAVERGLKRGAAGRTWREGQAGGV